jgi:hypothetical protein
MLLLEGLAWAVPKTVNHFRGFRPFLVVTHGLRVRIL